jgi:endonuclease G
MDDIRLKTDPEQLEGILEQFPDSAIIEALKHKGLLKPEKGKLLDGIHDGAHCQKTPEDFDDPGPALKVGKDILCDHEDLPLIERIVGIANFLPAHFLEEGAVVQRAVARVTLTDAHAGLPAGSGWATGFMVSPTLFLTNHHVIPSKAFANRIEMQFNYQLDYSGSAQTVDAFTANPNDSAFCTNQALDYTLIRMRPKQRFGMPTLTAANILGASETAVENGDGEMLERITPARSLSVARMARADLVTATSLPFLHRFHVKAGDVWGYIPLRDGFSLAGKQHLNIVQHPRGRRKEVALQENRISTIFANHMRYTTDTEPGSSGSPVFNNAWDVIALHHAAGKKDRAGNWVSNQGIRIDKIVADLRTHFGGISGGTAILDELGL